MKTDPHATSKEGSQSQDLDRQRLDDVSTGYFDVDLQIESIPTTPWLLEARSENAQEYSNLPTSPTPMSAAHFSTTSTLPIDKRAISGFGLARGDSCYPSSVSTPQAMYSTPYDSLQKLASPMPSPLPGQGFPLSKLLIVLSIKHY
jgi:hypothetical protein